MAATKPDVSEMLRRHVELVGECAIWAMKAGDAMKAGKREQAKRYLDRAESFLEAAKALEPTH